MTYGNEELREMLMKANAELSCLTQILVDMEAPVETIHNILRIPHYDDAEADCVHRLKHYGVVRKALRNMKQHRITFAYTGNVYFYSERVGVSWEKLENLFTNGSDYNGEDFVISVNDIVPILLKPLLDTAIEDRNADAIRVMIEGIVYVFEHLIESEGNIKESLAVNETP